MKKSKEKKSLIFASDRKGSFSRKIKKGTGILCAVFAVIMLLIVSVESSYYGTGWSYSHCFYLFLCVAGIFMYLNAVTKEKRMARFRYYRSFMEGKEYILLSEIERITGRKLKFLQKDLARMIREKLFLQANMNREGSCLFLTIDAFKRYQRGQLFLRADGKEVKDWEESQMDLSEEQETISHEDPSVYQKQTEKQDYQEQTAKQEGPDSQNQTANQKRADYQKQTARQEYPVQPGQPERPGADQPDWEVLLHKIHTIIGGIAHPDVKEPASRICIRGQQMIYFKDTMMKEEVARFLNYYLPMTFTILSTYEELVKEGLEDQTSDLKVLLNTIHSSFDQFAEKLIEGKRVDIEEDIAAVEMMFSNRS